jgi:hypothetical protein
MALPVTSVKLGTAIYCPPPHKVNGPTESDFVMAAKIDRAWFEG